MSNIFLKSFYNNVKDESWPIINTYDDFLKLPQDIQSECFYNHQLNQRLNEIESPDYWRNTLTKVYRYKNLAYLPVAKCGSSYYINLFHRQLNWESCNFSELDPGTICFGLFMDPIQRYLKGITEWVWNNFLPAVNYDISKVPESILRTIIIGDVHSLPYTTTLGTILDKVNCIPISGRSDSDIKKILTNLFRTQNHNIDLPVNDKKIHVSSELKIKLYNLIKENFDAYPVGDTDRCNSLEFCGRAEYLHILLSSDLKFYRDLVAKFDPNWKKILYN